jgi:Tol biopolymer transport system component
MVQFLRYVVAKTLEGDTAALRERPIGIAVFERPSDWDPKLDNIVRSEARRLRSKLEAYAAGSDQDETVRITMPTGGYAVQFEERSTDRERAVDSSTVIPYATVAELPQLSRKPSSRNTAWYGLVAIACLLFLVVSFLLNYRSGVRAHEDEYEIEPFSSEAGLQFSPAISPDSKKVAFVWDGGNGQFDLYTKTIGSSELNRLTRDSIPSTHPAWSPDGKQLAFLRQAGSEAELMVLDLSSHRERLIRRIQDSPNMWGLSNWLETCQTLSWNPGGDRLILTDYSGEGHGLISVSTITGEQTAISKPSGADQDCYARLSPDGGSIAFVRFLSHAVASLYTIDVAGDHLKRLTQEGKDLRGVDWTPDGSHLVFASKERGAYQLQLISVHGGEATPLPAATASAADPSVAPNGKFVIFVESHENWNLWQVGINGDRIGVPKRFIASTGQNHSPSFSPDGHSIAFVSDRSGNPEIWLCDRDGQHLRQLTYFGGPWLGTIRWSPDSRYIVFDARPRGHSSIYRMAVDQGSPVLLEDQPFEVRRPSWSRDGRYIYFDATRGGAPEIWRRDLETNQDQLIAPAGFMVGIESTNGKQLLYQESEQRHIWISDRDGGNPRRLADVRPTPDLDWAPMGNAILFASALSTGGTDILAFDIHSGASRRLGHLSQIFAPGTPSFVVSPDGQTLLYSALDSSSSEIKLRRGTLP